MPYTAEISRTNPTCILFLIDQSSSMEGPFGGQQGKKKSEGVSDAINRVLQNLVLKCAKADGVRDYFHIGVIGYGDTVTPLLKNVSENKVLHPISAVATSPMRVEQRKRLVDDGAGGFTEQSYRFPIWFEPVAEGKTAMYGALELAKQVIGGFLLRFPKCFPPLIINLTDGQPSDANPMQIASEIRALSSTDGQVLLFNAHISEQETVPVSFPSDDNRLPDIYAKVLLRMSSVLPDKLRLAAEEEGFAVNQNSRGFMFNADLVALVRFLEIGTRVASHIR
jgi:hypothetical protein